MKFLRAMLLASAVGIGGAVPAAAQQAAAPAPSPEAIAAAKDLIAVISPDMIKEMINKMFAQMWPAMEQALRTQFSTLDAATADQVRTEIRAALEKEMVAEMTPLMDNMPAVYAKYLTVDEMRAIRAFYSTPAGAKILKVMPEIMGEAMSGFGPRMQDMMQRLNGAVLGILQKHGLSPQGSVKPAQ